MKKLINEQFQRMQLLAGLITESSDSKFDQIALDHSNTPPNTPPGATAGTALDEVLDNLKDAQTTVTWIKTQLDEYIDGISDYGAGYKVEEKLEKILKLVATKFKISEDSFKIEDKSNTSYNSYDEGTVNGEIKLNGQSIVKYSSHDDGYGFSGEVDENALKAELEKLIKPITESIEKIVDKALRKHRRMLNEAVKSIDSNTIQRTGDTPITKEDLVIGTTRVAPSMSYGSKEELALNAGTVTKVDGDKATYDVKGKMFSMGLADLLIVITT